MKFDLTQIGREENICYEVANKDKLLAQKYPEAHIEGDLPEIIHPPIPDWLPMSKKQSWWKIFNLLVV